jgi:GT2 family glycosyltransferase
MKKLAILIPNYNGENFITKTVELFVSSFGETPVFVVDDASTDNSVKILQNSTSNLIERKTNGGFAAAINTGFKHLLANDFQYVLVANSDIEMDQQTAEQIYKSFDILESNTHIVVLGYSEHDANRNYKGSDISGFLFTLDLAMIRQIGNFDETFYMYGEEQDYFRRIQEAGYEIYQTGIEVKHPTEGAGGGRLKSSWLAMRNALYLETKRQLLWQMFRTFGVLFLTINRLYQPVGSAQDPSYRRIIRPGIILGNLFLLAALTWNLGKAISRSSNHYD